ncbi:MAG: hypothetical protein AAF389_08605 [Gemmatimonadota bacterium]
MTPSALNRSPAYSSVRAAVTLPVLLLLTLAAPIGATPAHDCEDLSGVYEVRVNLPGGGPTDIQLDLEQTDCDLTGFVGAMSRTAIDNGTVEDSTASFTFQTPNQGSGGMLEIRWTITLDGDTVTGTFSHSLFGDIPVNGTKVSQ